MADAAIPLPDDDLTDAPPLTDDELDAYLVYADEHGEPERSLLEVDDADGVGYVDEAVAALPVHRWRIESLADAEWAMARLAEAQRHVDELTAQREEWLRRASEKITRWFTRASRRSSRTVQVMAAKLERYALEQRAADPKVKSVPLPSGVIRTTEAKPKADVVDDDIVAMHVETMLDDSREHDEHAQRWWAALSTHAIDPDELVKRTPKVYVGPFRKLVTVADVPTGEVSWIITLSCGHDLDATTETGTSEPADPRLGETLACHVCEPDPIDGAPVCTVVALERIEVTEPRVLGPDGQPIPGTVVVPGRTTAEAVPGA